MADAPTPAARLQTARILWGAMLASTAAYAGVLLGGAVPPVPDGPTLPLPILIAVAASCAIASFLVPGILHRSALAKATFEIEELPLNMAPTGYRTEGLKYRRLTRAIYDSALRYYFTPLILSLALSESVATFGLVGAFTGQPILYCLPFIAAGALLIAVRFPTWRAAIAPIEKQCDAVAPPLT
jgi:hypothetical protein